MISPASFPNRSTSNERIRIHAWVYYGAPALTASADYKANKIDVLRVQYFKLLDDGILERIDEDSDDLYATQNGFSESNIQDISEHSAEQLVTVSGSIDSMRSLFACGSKKYNAINTLVKFVTTYELTGIDIDFETFGRWTLEDYDNYKAFVTSLGIRLRNAKKKLAICGPMWTSKESPLIWNYPDFVKLPVDYITPMLYDYQCDYGGGSPICPLSWLKEWTLNMLEIFPVERLVIGLPSYGYTATLDKYDIQNLTLEQIKEAGGYNGGKRDKESAEVIKITANGQVFVSNDKISLNTKLQLVQSLGIKQVSIWHLGGNDWF
ncbi:uncharacterized protein VTP21DRAFT_5342 [Calcarisporiella thermophila]|uniref:uncharacterized protein n=1 Tax=Calcarisporiella thermophila TaxID=911321 RepID=UPI003743A647